MKKIIILSLLFSFSLFACGDDGGLMNDTYIPMIVLGNQWNELAESGSLPPEYEYRRTYVSKIGAEVLLEGISYHKLLTAKDSLSEIWEENGFVREDIKNRKVYYKPIDKNEVLLYDFSVREGDSIPAYDFFFDTVHSWPQDSIKIKSVVLSVNSIFIGGIYRKKVEVISGYHNKHIWIEGIGGLDGFLRGNMDFEDVTGYERLSLLCFYQGEELIHKPNDSKSNDCFVWELVNNSENRH